MTSTPSAREEDLAKKGSLGTQLELLIGDKRGLVVLMGLLAVITAFAEAAMLVILAQVAADVITRKGAHHAHSRAAAVFHIHASIGVLLWLLIGAALFRLVMQWPISVIPARITSEVQQTLRSRVFRAFTGASWDAQSRDREGQLQEIMSSQTNQATGGALQATSLVSSALTFLILMGFAIAESPEAASVLFVVAVGAFLVMRPLRKLGNRRSRELSRAQLQYARSVAETNRLAEESHVFGVMEAQYGRVMSFARRCRELFYQTQLLSKAVPNLYQSLIFVLLAVGLALLYLIGGHQPEKLGAILLLLVRAAQQGQSIQGSYQSLQQSLPFLDRVKAAEQRYLASAPHVGEVALRQIGELAFDQVSFSYVPDRPVLEEISFEVQAGEAIGIVGPSGAGKSTLVQILLRLRLPEQGRYLINGADALEYSERDWHRLVAYVPQEPRLLHASVAENIRFFRELDDDAVRRAAQLARIHDDIIDWSDGYDTLIGPRADAVSGGQQQRICLARALAARPAVLVLDEPTSALDPQSETLIQESLLALKHELTLFTVAHRMSTLDMCDRVMVILDGRLAAFDTRAALQENSHYYRTAARIAASATGGGSVS